MDVGKHIRDAREDFGMSRNELARRVNVAGNHLYMIETGLRMPSLGLVERVAHELHVTPADLVREEPVEEPAVPKASAPPETGQISYEELKDENATLKEMVQELTAALAPENLLEALHDVGIQTSLAAASTVSIYLKRSVKHENLEPMLMDSYEEGVKDREEAWEWVFQQVRDLIEDYEGRIVLEDDGESSIHGFVERGAGARLAAASERSRREELRRANALDRDRGRG
jgi:transcriptional regulator with XRE-family HTH domain